MREIFRAWAILSIALVLSGCATAPPPSSAAQDAASAPAPRNVIVDPDAGTPEPVLAASPDGALYITGIDGPDPTIAVAGIPMSARFTPYVSRDAGATWEPLGTPFAPMNSVDAHIAVDAEVAVWALVDTFPCNSAGSSRDGGSTWTVSHLACGVPISDRPYVVPTSGGEAYVFYHNVHHQAARTSDYGATWTPLPLVEASARLADPVALGDWGGGAVHVPASGVLALTYGRHASPNAPMDPAILVSEDRGASWREHVIATPRGVVAGMGLVTVAADASGALHAAWTEEVAGTTAVMVASSIDAGRTWSAAAQVNDGARATAFASISAGPDGALAVAWYEADAPGVPDEAGPETRWQVALSTRGPGESAWEHRIVSDAPAKTGRICTQGAGCTSDRQLGEFLAIDHLPDGRVAVGWTSLEAVPGAIVNVVAIVRP